MIRRRRRNREVPFSFDSFLDVVANVCGIVIRLILVAWVGARSYPSIQRLLASAPSPTVESATDELTPPPEIAADIERHRRELAIAQSELLEKLRLVDDVKGRATAAESRLVGLSGRRDEIEQCLAQTDLGAPAGDVADNPSVLSLSDLNRRRQQLLSDIRSLKQLEKPGKVLRYQTPVSQPVQAEQFMFECRAERVSFIDLSALVAAARRDLPDKAEALKTQWQSEATTVAFGAFRLRYSLEREPGFADSMSNTPSPAHQAGYRYGLTGWVVEPLDPNRGESLTQALATGSEFRRVTDALDPRQAVVTFWVYPDSFALFRALRDHLYARDLVVAGRPLPLETPIAGSRHGTTSRGQ